MFIAAMLVARTYCDVWMIQNGTMIERSGFSVYVCFCYRSKSDDETVMNHRRGVRGGRAVCGRSVR